MFFETIDVRRMPGFDGGGFTVDKLSPGINIIYGPNGSGKTTTARALHAVLWPEIARKTDHVFVRLMWNDHPWTAHLDGGHTSWECNGEPANRPLLPAVESRDRYVLDLMQLLRAEDRGFARAIVQETLGGYDIALAERQLRLHQSPVGVQKVPGELARAAQNLKSVQDDHARAAEEEAQLANLHRRREKASQALERVRKWDAIDELWQAVNRKVEARKHVDSFPSWMEVLRGHEAEELDRLDDDRTRLEKEREEAKQRRLQALARRDDLGLPREGLPESFLMSTDGQLNQLDKAVKDGMQIQQQMKAARRVVTETALATPDFHGAVPTVKAEDVRTLTELAHDWQQHEAKWQDVEAERERWEKALADNVSSTVALDTLRQGIHLLHHWLRIDALYGDATRTSADDTPSEKLSRNAFLLAVTGWSLAFLATLGLAFSVHPGFGLAVVVTVAGLAFTLFRAREVLGQQPTDEHTGSPSPAQQRSLRENDFASLNLPMPSAWEHDAVWAHWEHFQRQLQQAEETERVRHRLEQLMQIRARLVEEREALTSRGRQLLASYGLSSDRKLYDAWWLLQQLHEGQKAQQTWTSLQMELQAVVQTVETIGSQLEAAFRSIAVDVPPLPQMFSTKELIEEAREETAALGAASGTDGDVMPMATYVAALENYRATWAVLQSKSQRWDEATREAEEAQRDVQRAEANLANVTTRRKQLLAPFQYDADANGRHADGIQADTEPGFMAVDDPENAIRDGCTRLQSYKDALKTLDQARYDRNRALEQLRRIVPGIDDPFDWENSLVAGRPLSAWTQSEIESRRDEAARQAAELDAIQADMNRIEGQASALKKGRTLEEALARHHRAEQALVHLFQEEAQLEIGRMLVNYVRNHIQQKDRPHVFHLARAHFSHITRGAFDLTIEDGDDPVFRAVDTATGRGKSLDELSGGTRAQLLIAVRVAFVEAQETSVRLPIIFDEALANSDDVRADGIIKAVLRLAASGRQVFYMTAQADEAHKWKSTLNDQSEVDYTFVPLGERRERQMVAIQPLVDHRDAASSLSLQVPSPKEAGVADLLLRPNGDVGTQADAMATPTDTDEYIAYGRLLQVPGIHPRRWQEGSVHLWHLLDNAHVLYELLRISLHTWGQWQTLHEQGVLREVGEWTNEAYRKAHAASRCLGYIVEGWRIGRGQPIDRQVLMDSGYVTDTFIDAAAELAAQHDSDAAAWMAAVDEGDLPRFQQRNKDGIREYFEANGFIDRSNPLSREEVTTRALARMGAELDAGVLTLPHVERLIVAVFHHDSST